MQEMQDRFDFRAMIALQSFSLGFYSELRDVASHVIQVLIILDCRVSTGETICRKPNSIKRAAEKDDIYNPDKFDCRAIVHSIKAFLGNVTGK